MSLYIISLYHYIYDLQWLMCSQGIIVYIRENISTITGLFKSSLHIVMTITGSDCLIGPPIVQALHVATYRRVLNET